MMAFRTTTGDGIAFSANDISGRILHMASATTGSRTSSGAFALSLASEVIIIFGGILSWLFFANFQTSLMDGMKGGMMMGNWSAGSWFMGGWLFPLSLVAGAMVLLGAIMMNARPHETRNWGIIVPIFLALGVAGMGLSILGGIIGISGGAMALYFLAIHIAELAGLSILLRITLL